MRRGVNGIDALETINAAATVISSAETRGPRDSVQKKRWGSCWNLYRCFGSSKNNKRIGHAVLVPEPTTPTERPDPPASEHLPPNQPLSITVPFVAPPSSPASFLPSEPPSTAQSPKGLLTQVTSVSSNMMSSPSGPTSIFAVGPYAHDTQLVSPPVFSTFTTEPSTAPYTPPPESVHMTTPSSPEVPFARLLEPNSQNSSQRYPFTQYELQSYQLQPGSPVSHLISPSSGISGSGTSSPFLDLDFAAANCPFFLEFRTGNHPPKLLDLEKIVSDAMGPRLDRENSDVSPLRRGLVSDAPVVNHRVSFDMNGDVELVRCAEKKPLAYPELELGSIGNFEHTREEKRMKPENGSKHEETPDINRADDGDNSDHKQQKTRKFTLGSAKEFNFESTSDRIYDKPGIDSSNWWVNEKVAVEDGSPDNHWLFFPPGRFSR
ncbi:hydroxyproline-rich glycoprotein family protein [Striga hermonthica]|uniref:Hydroxyproline-rich glycoprotein family protein n=1 Tax=Striga hermonthica TaxID=68872 RepID=A0A9N7NKE9_STRHE|nr:hydroxyproline-rich glycoprotein family protein [Striga hermonthica]